ncbi:MAG TPA: YmdB family metallophosphoesterase, partial [Thermoanaerobaculia bacterium]|nr:YmdB family metallophosphoesterase [Thermoanaerobaculia bacterium]
MTRILYIGDVVGQPGRKALRAKLESVIDREKVDFTIVNIENAAAGFGVTEGILDELSDLPIDLYTSGNHIWDKKEFVERLDELDNIIRPANYPEGNPGRGRAVKKTASGVKVGVIQVMGQVFMPPCDNPFYVIESELKALEPNVK